MKITMERNNQYMITKRFEIVGEYMSNQTDENWLRMIQEIMGHELEDGWDDEARDIIVKAHVIFTRMADAIN